MTRLADRLRAALARPLPAGVAPRAADLDLVDWSIEPRTAAVLVPVTDRIDPGIILTQRHAALRSHAGQVAFPGGKVDPDDSSLEAAALREAQEEIGLDPAAVEIVGMLEPYRTGSGFLITAVIGVVPPDLPLVPHEIEVEAIFEVPIHVLFDPANWSEDSVERRGLRRRYREMMCQDRRLWGATGAMIGNLAQRLADV
jgi:8-oxo-dGTP pyrophosphatase MutT (NUDIX family)